MYLADVDGPVGTPDDVVRSALGGRVRRWRRQRGAGRYHGHVALLDDLGGPPGPFIDLAAALERIRGARGIVRFYGGKRENKRHRNRIWRLRKR